MKKYKNPLGREYLSADDVLMLPNYGKVNSRSEIQLKPFIYSAPMDTVTGYEMTKAMIEKNEFAVVSRFIEKEERTKCLKEFGKLENVFFAVGLDDFKEFLHLKEESISPPWTKINVALDIAHGDMAKAHNIYRQLMKNRKIRYIMSGSICTPSAALRAKSSGCTHLRVGVGPGAACTTRMMTGIGMPQLSAVYNIYKELQEFSNRPIIIADGGIKTPGQAAKYLAAGADAIMMGSVLSKCWEAPGWSIEEDGYVKSYRGQASAEFQKSIYGKANHCPEGKASAPFSYRGDTVDSVVEYYRGGIISSCSYLGITSMEDMIPKNIHFIKITPSAYNEGTAHGV